MAKDQQEIRRKLRILDHAAALEAASVTTTSVPSPLISVTASKNGLAA